ncbi:SurA N-terminal domain-containing protein [Legionella maioricensis]|uniref:Periplasmic chaperone PpiD n=1 Tax=Legionella maioricensis TaxID=2896528 RepID=A0A9X2I8R1_9GAMM|nr:SurA N-terminal domain-containing protein [Legionella maioricensis]MCL9682580.1 SurA N-terminal domain-containing protein [Legionella maioricensis]MCL9686173.1 SurA N-terminal domain-containing protein [Legionella maioricensis]
MLQKLNERIQGVVAWLVIILIAITFTLFGVDYYMQSHQTSDAKVVVNDKPITNQAFETNYRRTRAQQDMAQMTAGDEKNLQNQVLNQMITNEVTLQSARHYGFEVSAEQANAAIVNIPQFQEDGHFSTQRYQQALSGALFTPETFQNEVRQGMLLNQQRFAFMGSSFALPAEIKRFVRLYMQTRDYEYVIVPAARFEKEIKVSEDKISEYYKKHQKEFMTPEQVSIDYVMLSMGDIRSKIKISNEDVKRYYDENQSNFLTPAQWQVAHILFAVPDNASQEEMEQAQKKAEAAYNELKKNPDQFNQFVTSMSDDKLSLADKGVLPWITAGQSEYGKLLSNLTQPGQISLPEKTKHGYEIFKLIAYKPVTTRSLAEVDSMIREQLLTDMAQAQYAQALEQLSDLSYQSPDSLKPVSDALGLKIQHSEPFSRFSGTKSLTKNKQVSNAAFSHDVLDLGNNSDPVQLNNDSVIVLRVNTHIPTKEQPLATVHNEIEKILAKKLAEAKAKKIGAALLNPVEDKQQQELMSVNQLQWQAVVNAARDNDKSNALINDLAFNLLRPESRDGVILENGDYVVVKLKRINDGQLSTLDQEQRNSLIQQIESSYGMMDYDLYVNSLMKHAQIVKH